MVRRHTPAVIEFSHRWWDEVARWSVQDQLSLPYVLRTSDIRWHAWPGECAGRAEPFGAGWLRYGLIGTQ